MVFNRRSLAIFVAISAVTHAGASMVSDVSRFGGLQTMNDAALDEMRGGFTGSDGLNISFGIDRAVYINGALAVTTSLNVTDMTGWVPGLVQSAQQIASSIVTPLTAAQSEAAASTQSMAQQSTAPQPTAQAQQSAAQQSISQLQPATTSAGATANQAAPVAQASSPSAVTSAAPSTSATQTSTGHAQTATPQVQTLNGGRLAVIQSGPNNTFQPGEINAGAIGTIVQNSLNNQKIQSITVINASVNSMKVSNSLNLQRTINTAVIDSLGR